MYEALKTCKEKWILFLKKKKTHYLSSILVPLLTIAYDDSVLERNCRSLITIFPISVCKTCARSAERTRHKRKQAFFSRCPCWLQNNGLYWLLLRSRARASRLRATATGRDPDIKYKWNSRANSRYNVTHKQGTANVCRGRQGIDDNPGADRPNARS